MSSASIFSWLGVLYQTWTLWYCVDFKFNFVTVGYSWHVSATFKLLGISIIQALLDSKALLIDCLSWQLTTPLHAIEAIPLVGQSELELLRSWVLSKWCPQKESLTFKFLVPTKDFKKKSVFCASITKHLNGGFLT